MKLHLNMVGYMASTQVSVEVYVKTPRTGITEMKEGGRGVGIEPGSRKSSEATSCHTNINPCDTSIEYHRVACIRLQANRVSPVVEATLGMYILPVLNNPSGRRNRIIRYNTPLHYSSTLA